MLLDWFDFPKPGITCSKLTIKTLEPSVNNKDIRITSWRCFGVFIVNFEHIQHPVLEFILLFVKFEHVNAG